MFGFPESPRAWPLTRVMAGRAGLNLRQAVLEGWLSRQELACFISRCESCACHAPCDRWLSTSPAPGEIPSHCPNKSGLEALAP
ncbi:DUF6455 family protein [Xinfangfangia sp. CPCC 101601]|uniref:DUF6455 family protein n=1 Tax=Pseudogemmobacter lacusdianii TaxID=3069608 RepID=A0ABU0VSW3_9RHOB|nr:DUF6455 family protein [Xinfangfangia sp. CPCC 101601]MDQ2064814.1 DUF6455 family protein [Xinfangfangia sp. CPCC 101601]